MTSTRSPLAPCATEIILSAGCNSPCLSAGPAVIKRSTIVYSVSLRKTAPIPSSDKRILIEKFSDVRGDK